MQTALLTIHLIITLVLVGLVLIQRSEGGGLGMGSGNLGGLMTSRGTANLLTRTTGIFAALFFVSTIGLALFFKGAQTPQSILDIPVSTAPATVNHTVPAAPVTAATTTPSAPSTAVKAAPATDTKTTAPQTETTKK